MTDSINLTLNISTPTIEQVARDLGGNIQPHKYYNFVTFPTHKAAAAFMRACDIRGVEWKQWADGITFSTAISKHWRVAE